MVKMNIYIRNSSGWELFFSNIHGKYDRFDMNLPKNTPNWKYFFTKENHPNPKTFECSKALDLIRSAGDKRCEDSRDGLWDEWFEASVEEGLESTWRCYRNILSVFGVSDGGEWWWKVFFFWGGQGPRKMFNLQLCWVRLGFQCCFHLPNNKKQTLNTSQLPAEVEVKWSTPVQDISDSHAISSKTSKLLISSYFTKNNHKKHRKAGGKIYSMNFHQGA